MECVDGESITAYCDRHRLSTGERLALFMRVCEGVQHAHRKGIIHRDIKPSNILITIQGDEPVPKIIDFGVAKATQQRLTEKTLFTALGAMIGTPAYMSPEQAEMTGLDVDTRTDVYSLGVVLYELIVGALPFDPEGWRSAGYDEIRRRIREDEPSKPSTRLSTLGDDSTDSAEKRRTDLPGLRRQLRGDLDWITLKALEKDRTRRYGSPSDLAEDIRRHLRNEPVVASPPSTAYRAEKFVRRHKAGVGAAALLVGFLISVAILMTAQSARVARERDRAEQEASKARAVTDFLQQTLASADPELGGGRQVTIAEVLDGAVKEIDGSFQNQRDVRAAIENTIGVTYTSLGEYSQAEKHLASALEWRREMYGDKHLDVAESLLSLGILRNAQSDFGAAEKLLLEALTTRRTILGDESLAVAEVLQALGDLGEPPDLDKAESYYREALAIRMGRADPKDVADSLFGLAEVLSYQGEYEESERLHLEALDMRRQRLGEEHIDVADSLNDLAILSRHRKDYDRAEAYMRESLAVTRIAYGSQHPLVGTSLFNLASVLNAKGAHDAAEAPAREGLAMMHQIVGPGHVNTGIAYAVLASSLRGQKRFVESEQMYVQSIGILRERGALPHRIAIRQSEYATVLTSLGKHEEAERELLSALEVLRGHYPDGNDFTRSTCSSLVRLYEAWGKPEKAVEYRVMLEAM
jgi:non-specific serine/threonine protein kinase/serine/threonine-protein kinase